MPTTSAYSVVSAVLPDWPGGSPPAFAEPTAASSFDALLQPRPASSSTVCTGGNCYAPPEESTTQGDPPTHGADDDGAERGPQASNDQPVNETARPEEESPGDESAPEVVQSLSGAAAVVDRTVLEGDVDLGTENVAPIAEPKPAETADGEDASVATAADIDAQAELLSASNRETSAGEIAPELAAKVAGDNAIATIKHHAGDTTNAPTEQLDAEDRKANLPPEDRAEQREGSQRLNRNLNAHAGQGPSENVPTPIAASEIRSDAQGQSIADQQGPATAATASPTIGAAAAAEPAHSRLPAGTAATETGATASRGGMEVDSARLLQRVARAFAQAADGRGEVTIRLNPPELGSLRLEVRMHEGALAARMQTETTEARTAILDNLPILRERLADQGVRIERFDVDLMNRQPGDSPQQPFGEQRESPRAIRPTAAPRATANPLPTSTPRTSLADPGRLNVII